MSHEDATKISGHGANYHSHRNEEKNGPVHFIYRLFWAADELIEGAISKFS